MSLQVNRQGTWVNLQSTQVRHNGTWKVPTSGWVKNNGVWKQIPLGGFVPMYSSTVSTFDSRPYGGAYVGVSGSIGPYNIVSSYIYQNSGVISLGLDTRAAGFTKIRFGGVSGILCSLSEPVYTYVNDGKFSFNQTDYQILAQDFGALFNLVANSGGNILLEIGN